MPAAALLLAAALSASAKAPAVPVGDSIVGMDAKMERIEPQAGSLLKACERLLSLSEQYAKGRNPDDPALGRAAVRAEVQSAADRVQTSVGEFWHMAEALRVSQTVGFVADTVSGKKPDAGKAAATILQTPAFPKVVMDLHQVSILALGFDERAYLAAKARRTREVRQRGMFVGGGLVVGALVAMVAFGLAERSRPALPARPTPKPPARLE